MVEAMCISSHEQPGKEAGKFNKYVAGQVYEIPELNRHFKQVKAGTLKKLAEGKTTEEATGKGGKGK